jgi:hypothetical protein
MGCILLMRKGKRNMTSIKKTTWRKTASIEGWHVAASLDRSKSGLFG